MPAIAIAAPRIKERVAKMQVSNRVSAHQRKATGVRVPARTRCLVRVSASAAQQQQQQHREMEASRRQLLLSVAGLAAASSMGVVPMANAGEVHRGLVSEHVAGAVADRHALQPAPRSPAAQLGLPLGLCVCCIHASSQTSSTRRCLAWLPLPPLMVAMEATLTRCPR